MSQTLAGLINDENRMQRAIDELLKAGVDRSEIGLVAPEVRRESERVLSGTRKGLAAGAAAGMLLGGVAMLVPGIGPALVAGPLLAVPVLGTLVGGLVGALTASGIAESDAHFYAEGVRRGGALLTVRVDSPQQARRVERILRENDAAASAPQSGSGDQR